MDAMDQGYGREDGGRGSQGGDLRRQRGSSEPLDQRMDRWVSAGRQFVEGVAGSRPGGRPAPRAGDRRAPRRLRLDNLGRWVEDRLDWLLEDGDDWREPWQEEERAAPAPPPPPAAGRRRQALEAVSRRGRSASLEDPSEPSGGSDDDWPDEASFSLPRWQRPESTGPRSPVPRAPARSGENPPSSQPGSSPGARPAARPLPRSSRRRS